MKAGDFLPLGQSLCFIVVASRCINTYLFKSNYTQKRNMSLIATTPYRKRNYAMPNFKRTHEQLN